MDDVLFECIYTDSEELLTEYYRNVREKSKVDLGYALIIFSVVVLLLVFWQAKIGWIATAVALFGLGLYYVGLPARLAKGVMDNIRRINHGIVPSAKVVITDRITHYYRSDIFVMVFPYIRFVYFLKRSIVLVGDEGYATFERDGFTKGSAEAFETFLREKHPHIQIIHKAKP